MIKVNEKTEKVLNQMYNILIQNLFINYPKFLKEKEKHDNNENYQKWINMIKETPNYNIITEEENEKVLGFLNYQIENDKLWICEVQIRDENKQSHILKKLLKKFVSLNNNYKTVTIHINKNNTVSKKVFIHIGFKYIGNTLYKINMKALENYTKN